MSVYYDAQEHFVILDAEEGIEYVDLLRGHLAMVGALMLCGEVGACSIQMATDQKTCQFSGTRVNEKLHEVMDALDQAQKIDLSLSWHYRGTAWGGISNLAGVTAMCSLMENQAKEEAIPKSVFYCCYLEADRWEGIGRLQAYGYRNERYFTGDVPYEAIDTLPEEGVWRTPQTAVIWDVEWPEGANRQRITEVAEELSTLSSLDEVSIDENSISLFINNLMLHGRKDLEKYLAFAAELYQLTNGECFIAEELEDCDSLNPRILSMNLDEAGQWHYQIAEV